MILILLTSILCTTVLIGFAIESIAEVKNRRIAADLKALELRARIAEAEAKGRAAREARP